MLVLVNSFYFSAGGASEIKAIKAEPQRGAADVRVGPAPLADRGLAEPLHALRAMVSEASTRANQHFAIGTIQPSKTQH